ncbi:MAG: vitamin K epoxide reductase family protein [Bacteroidia bacterium]|nr:vitamin K epoxide reductase family protein [Bacteroidia bacterium]
MVMNGWMADEIAVQQQFILHPMPNSLRCVSDVLDYFGIEHRISRANSISPDEITKETALFIPQLSQPLILGENVEGHYSREDYADIYEIRITTGTAKRRNIGSFIRHLIWKLDEWVIVGLIITTLFLALLSVAWMNRLSTFDALFALTLFTGWLFSGLAVYKSAFNKSASKGLCYLSGQDSCSKLLGSNGAKLFGLIPLGTLALIYYCILLTTFVLMPTNIGTRVVIGCASILALPMIVYSIYLQLKLRRFCPICTGIDISLSVQILFSLRIVTTLPDYSTILNAVFFTSLSFAACLFAAILMDRRKKWLMENNTLRIKHENLLYRTDIFPFLIGKQPLLIKDSDIDFITLSNKASEYEHTLVVVLNPLCFHCRQIVKSIQSLEDFRINIILASPTEEAIILSSWLIKLYTEKKDDAFTKTIEGWWDGEEPPEDWAPGKEISSIAYRHNAFVIDHGINKTPFVLYDGKELPDIYDYNDLNYLYYE